MSRRPELALVAFFSLAVAAAVVAGLRNTPGGADGGTASAFLAGPDGAKAAYDVLQRLGRPVERRRTPLYDLTRVRRPPALLVVLDPPDDLTAAELEQVVRYVRSGGEVLAAGDGGGITHCTGWDAHTAFLKGYAGDSQPVQQPVPALELPSVTAVLRPLDSLLSLRSRDTRRRVRRNLDRESGCSGLAVPAQDTLLRTEHGKPVILRLRYAGGGVVTLAADPGYFRNRAWRTTDVPPFMVPLLTPGTRGQGRGRVTWDEYHQGFGRGGSLEGAVLDWLARTPAGWALLQLVGVGLVALAVAAVRFGPARSVIDRRRRSPLEHVEALAVSLQGAGGVDTAVALIVAGLRRRLGRAGVVQPEDQRAWLSALELALPTTRARDAVRRLQQAQTQPGGAERALVAAQALEDVWEELRPQTTRAGS
jgi:Domain of unknown function (DUF4350)